MYVGECRAVGFGVLCVFLVSLVGGWVVGVLVGVGVGVGFFILFLICVWRWGEGLTLLLT
jgi:hypothetical protein